MFPNEFQVTVLLQLYVYVFVMFLQLLPKPHKKHRWHCFIYGKRKLKCSKLLLEIKQDTYTSMCHTNLKVKFFKSEVSPNTSYARFQVLLVIYFSFHLNTLFYLLQLIVSTRKFVLPNGYVCRMTVLLRWSRDTRKIKKGSTLLWDLEVWQWSVSHYCFTCALQKEGINKLKWDHFVYIQLFVFFFFVVERYVKFLSVSGLHFANIIRAPQHYFQNAGHSEIVYPVKLKLKPLIPNLLHDFSGPWCPYISRH